MNRREALQTSFAFFASLALSAKTVGALPVGFPRETGAQDAHTQYDIVFNENEGYGGRFFFLEPGDPMPDGYVKWIEYVEPQAS